MASFLYIINFQLFAFLQIESRILKSIHIYVFLFSSFFVTFLKYTELIT